MRLLPRFSLRFVWIALTIFLIVFAVVASYWKRSLEHEAIVKRLQAVNFEVEEEPITFAGICFGKVLTGLEYPAQDHGAISQSLLQEIPCPGDVRRFGHDILIHHQDSLDDLLRSIVRFEKLEELYLQHVIFTEPQIRRLESLRELRILDLSYGNLPPGSLSFLERLPKLEILRLRSAQFQAAQLAELNLPNLRIMDLRETALTELPLTKQGWGRFPKLETIILGETKLAKIVFEPGAMPALKFLDLALQDSACEVDWVHLPEAAPALTGLAIHTSHLSADLVPALGRLAHLRYLRLQNTPFRGVPYQYNLTTLLSNKHPAFLGNRDGDPFGPSYDRAIWSGPPAIEIVVPQSVESYARAIVEQSPKVLFCHELETFQELILPYEGSNSHAWKSTNWREAPGFGGQNNGGGGFF